ncbi:MULTISPECIES: hypothetical protein [unclassified Rhizobium]|uniref:hypothetical protein n=1 Tax=unclassified Rhizobium TaxID=2613769 RepID=UPI001160AC03|nr:MULTISPECIES: hypothetical protein [unclassified Rhizobium]MBO9135078.1 hypothetical protein [Rhizobium sp. B209b/85]MBO9186878.1 hypothetical protein [Rhizobium sp. E27B/91]QXZ81008.1 hypothetical protein J5274_19045 [Rhizobium sp. L51/94]QXZ98009.1 hypothetical protein J5289_22125 [Rhizobium sp. B230/85]QYA03830.1 hypothetical protein J5278_23890 [Rhizobium sp. B21/90]
MDTGKGAKPENDRRKSKWLVAGTLMVASAAIGWWLAGPTSDDNNASQILATAPPADTAASGTHAATNP